MSETETWLPELADLPLARRIWRRFGGAPGVISTALVEDLSRRGSRFGASGLAGEIQARWTPSAGETTGSALHLRWPAVADHLSWPGAADVQRLADTSAQPTRFATAPSPGLGLRSADRTVAGSPEMERPIVRRKAAGLDPSSQGSAAGEARLAEGDREGLGDPQGDGPSRLAQVFRNQAPAPGAAEMQRFADTFEKPTHLETVPSLGPGSPRQMERPIVRRKAAGSHPSSLSPRPADPAQLRREAPPIAGPSPEPPRSASQRSLPTQHLSPPGEREAGDAILRRSVKAGRTAGLTLPAEVHRGEWPAARPQPGLEVAAESPPIPERARPVTVLRGRPMVGEADAAQSLGPALALPRAAGTAALRGSAATEFPSRRAGAPLLFVRSSAQPVAASASLPLARAPRSVGSVAAGTIQRSPAAPPAPVASGSSPSALPKPEAAVRQTDSGGAAGCGGSEDTDGAGGEMGSERSDADDLVEQVLRRLARSLAVESERLGRWPWTS